MIIRLERDQYHPILALGLGSLRPRRWFTAASPPDGSLRLRRPMVHCGFAARCEARLCLAVETHNRLGAGFTAASPMVHCSCAARCEASLAVETQLRFWGWVHCSLAARCFTAASPLDASLRPRRSMLHCGLAARCFTAASPLAMLHCGLAARCFTAASPLDASLRPRRPMVHCGLADGSPRLRRPM